MGTSTLEWLRLAELIFALGLLVVTCGAVIWLLALFIDNTLLKRAHRPRRSSFMAEEIALRMREYGESREQAKAAVKKRLTVIIQEAVTTGGRR